MMLTIKEAAAELRVSQQWLKYWLVENPVDTDGLALYVPMGKRWKFHPTDLERILNHMRKLEAARLGPSVKSKIRMMDLMSQLGGSSYEKLVQMRKGNTHSVTARASSPADVLADLAVGNVTYESRLRMREAKKQRARLPRAKRPDRSE